MPFKEQEQTQQMKDIDPTKESQKGRMRKAYKIATEMTKDRMREERPEDLNILDKMEESDVIVVRGQYDHIEQNLSLARIPFTIIDGSQFDRISLRPDQMLMVNCPGNSFSVEGIMKLRTFVESGGDLFTTDWALKHVLEPAFPDFVRFNERKTDDEVVRVIIHDEENPHVKQFLGPNDDPVWWLEGSSYPIEVLNKEKVKILISSKEIEEKYGESPVLITFEYGKGKITHMISHFYLQRSETRTTRHAAPSMAYAVEKGFSKEQQAKYEAMGAADVTTAEVESALFSQAQITDMILEKKKKHMK